MWRGGKDGREAGALFIYVFKVICPGHLTQQWYEEILKHTVPQLSILSSVIYSFIYIYFLNVVDAIMLTSLADLKSISYADIAYAGRWRV